VAGRDRRHFHPGSDPDGRTQPAGVLLPIQVDVPAYGANYPIGYVVGTPLTVTLLCYGLRPTQEHCVSDGNPI